MKNAFTVDLEDWFCSHNLVSAIRYDDWHRLESRVEINTHTLLAILQKKQVKATFFVLGWIADQFPQLIKVIHREGHEIASHGYAHQQLTVIDATSFRTDVTLSIKAIGNATGCTPAGYRAPAFSITRHTSWAFPLLKEMGFDYDSSVYPFSFHPEYGNGKMPLHIHSLPNGLVELPLSCASFGKLRLPCSGGAYLRFYPISLFYRMVEQVNRNNRPFIFYIHPWELDKKPPRVRLPMSRQLRHYYNTATTVAKIDALLNKFEFTSIAEILNPS